MKLEKQMYEIPRIKERIYQIGDLENLSATALHYGEGGGSSGGFSGGGFGGISKKDMDKYGIVITPQMIPKIRPSQNLTIRDFPASGFQLHIHEGETTKPSSIMDYSRNKFCLPSYDAAMADGGKPAYDAMKLLHSLNELTEFEEFKKRVLGSK